MRVKVKVESENEDGKSDELPRPPACTFTLHLQRNVTPGASGHLQVQLPDYGPYIPPE